MEVVLRIPFIALRNADIQFDIKSLTSESYSAAEALPTARRVELINKHEFAQTTLDERSKTFVVHVVAMEALDLAIHPSQALLLADI